MLVIEPTKGRSLTDWSEINWTAVEGNVKHLQGRIFRAAKRGEHKKVKNLQKLLARSASAKLLAIRRVTQQNRGKHTPGIDGVVCDTPEARLKLFKGKALAEGRRSATHTLYDEATVTFEADEVYDQADAEGFIRLQSLRLRTFAEKRLGEGE